MKNTFQVLIYIILPLLFIASGCCCIDRLTSNGDKQYLLGILKAGGNEVYVNNRLIENGSTTNIYRQDKVTIKKESKAHISFEKHVSMIFDKETEASFEYNDNSITTDMRYGRIYLDKNESSQIKVAIKIGDNGVLTCSKVNIEFSKDQSSAVVTVEEGKIVILRNGKKEMATSLQKIVVDKTGPGKPENISKQAVCETVRWTGLPCSVKEPSKDNNRNDNGNLADFNIIYFKFDKYTLSDEENINKIKAVVGECLKYNSGCLIYVNGYTDSIGSRSYNKRLSKRRAETVRLAISKQCNEQKCRIIPKGFGEDNPCKSNSTNDGRQINRRVEICAIPGGSQQSKENLCEQERNKICDYKSQQ